MSDDYKCYKCLFFNHANRTCKSLVGCINEEADIFEENEFNMNSRSPESHKTRRQHFQDMSNHDLADFIKNYVTNKCKFCENRGKCISRSKCVEGIEKWLNKGVGIYDD